MAHLSFSLDAAQVLKATTALLQHLHKEAAGRDRQALLDGEGGGAALYLTLNLRRIQGRSSLKALRM